MDEINKNKYIKYNYNIFKYRPLGTVAKKQPHKWKLK